MDTRTDRQEFERQVLAGELTNIEQYFDDESAQEERYLLDKHGINVDRVIDMDGTDVIVRFIRDSMHKERYDEWKDHPNKDVRLELAMHGYFLEQYIPFRYHHQAGWSCKLSTTKRVVSMMDRA